MHQSKVCNTSGAMDGSRSHLPPQFPGWEWTSKQALQWSLFAKMDDGYGPIWHILNGLLDAFKILPFYGRYSSQVLKHFCGNRWFSSWQTPQWSLFAKIDDGYGPIWHILNGLLDAFKILPFYGKYSSQILKHFRGNRWFSLCNIISFVRLRVPPKYMVCVSGTYFLGRYGPIYLILD